MESFFDLRILLDNISLSVVSLPSRIYNYSLFPAFDWKLFIGQKKLRTHAQRVTDRSASIENIKEGKKKMNRLLHNAIDHIRVYIFEYRKITPRNF